MKLAIQNISYRVGEFSILDQVTAEAKGGDAVGLVGPNGAGKTTLANIISGFIAPSSGKISLDGVTLTGRSPSEIGRLSVARMFQDQHLAWNLSVLENVLAGLDTQTDLSWSRSLLQHRSYLKTNRAKTERAMEILDKVSLAGQRLLPARDLSFGQQRLLALARALARPSSLLLLDEPFTGVKSTALQLTLRVLEDEVRQGRILLLIDHTLSAVRSIANKIWFMERGRLTHFVDFSTMIRSDVFTNFYLGFNKGRERTIETSSMQHHTAEADSNESQHTTEIQMDTAVPELHASAQNGKSSTEPRKNPSLSLQSVSGGYGSRIIVNDVNLDVLTGDVLCILGLNGSGKSTLLRIIAGVASRFSGSIRLEGRAITRLRSDERIRRGMRFLPQDHRVFRTLSVTENLLLSVTGAGPESSQGLPLFSRGVISAMLSTLPQAIRSATNTFGNRSAGTLSGGEQAKIALSQLEYGSPKVMLLDEPTSGIDGASKANLIDLILQWKEYNFAVVIVEHDMDFVLSVATRITILNEGNLIELPSINSLTPDTLLNAILVKGNN